MKQIAYVLILGLLCLHKASASSCRPFITYSTETDSGCPGLGYVAGLSKSVNYNLEWPDGYAEGLWNVAGTGKCQDSPVCCSQNLASIECWPLYHPPLLPAVHFLNS
jgi:hypothetical protein